MKATKFLDDTPLPNWIGQRSTILASWVVFVRRYLRYLSLDDEAIFQNAGITDDEIARPANRVPHEKMLAVWNSVKAAHNDYSFATKASHSAFPGMFHTLSLAMYASETPFIALKHLVRYRRLIHPLARVSIRETPDGVDLTIGPPRAPYVEPTGSLVFLFSVLGLLKDIGGDDCRPTDIRLICAEDSGKQVFESFMDCPVHLGVEMNAVRFDREILFSRSLLFDRELEQTCIRQSRRCLSTLEKTEAVNSVYCKLVELMPKREYGEETIAEEMYMSGRTLQRHLSAAGTSYSEILQAVRLDLSVQYLKEGSLSVTQISDALGFAHPTNFVRAFKAWTGRTPAEFRTK